VPANDFKQWFVYYKAVFEERYRVERRKGQKRLKGLKRLKGFRI
jgi:hypothetical protein